MNTTEINIGRGRTKSVRVGTYQIEIFSAESNVEYHKKYVVPRRRVVRADGYFKRYRRINYVHIPHRDRFNIGQYRNTKGYLYGYNDSYPYNQLRIRFERFREGDEYAFITSRFRNVKNETMIADDESMTELGDAIKRYWIYVNSIFRTY